MNKLRLTHKHPADLPETTVISVLSGKGGVGKSILSFNIAERLAAAGHRTLIVDADLSSGNQHIFTNTRCEFGVKQFADGELSLLEAASSVSLNLDLLGASRTGRIIETLDVQGAARLMHALRRESGDYDYIVMDHASGISEPATVLAQASDVNLLVLVPELTSIADAYGLYKFLLDTNRSIDCRLLINRAHSDEEADYIQRKFTALAQRFLQTSPRVMGYLLESDSFRRSLARQCPLSQTAPDSAVVQTLTRIVQNLISPVQETQDIHTGPTQMTRNENPATADIKG